MGWQPPEIVVETKCPELKEYTQERLNKAAREQRALLKADPNAETPKFIRDYRQIREMCRAYQARPQ